MWKNNLALWLKSSISQEDKNIINSMSKKQQKEAFSDYVKFGTAGVRGVRRLGPNGINIYNIRMFSLAYGRYILKNVKAHKHKVAIAYDNRHMSKEFSYEAAKVFGALGIKTYIFKEPRPTPQLSWVISYKNLHGGLVLTASHNPPEDNGYKIYDDTGCQIVQHKYKLFEKELNLVMDNFDIDILSLKQLQEKALIEYLEDKYDDAYIKEVAKIRLNPIKKQKITVAYTSQHGAGAVVTEKLFKSLNLKLYVEQKQRPVDPDFTYAPFPNPEEPKAYHEVMKLGKKVNADIIMSTDPDADRFGCGILHNKEYRLLNGNETAELVIDYIINHHKKNNTLPPNAYSIFTNITGSLGKAICEKNGVKMFETLTGFKWIGDVFNQQIAKGNNNLICGYEEAYGFILSDMGKDKDSLQASLLLSEMVQYYKEKNKTLIDRLDEIYQEYGYYGEFTQYAKLEGLEGKKTINKIIEKLKSFSPQDILDQGFVSFLNYFNQLKYTKDKTIKINLPSHPAFKLYFDKKDWVAFRPSGTEPKIKFYYNVVGKNPKERDKKIKNVIKYVKSFLKECGISINEIDNWFR